MMQYNLAVTTQKNLRRPTGSHDPNQLEDTLSLAVLEN